MELKWRKFFLQRLICKNLLLLHTFVVIMTMNLIGLSKIQKMALLIAILKMELVMARLLQILLFQNYPQNQLQAEIQILQKMMSFTIRVIIVDRILQMMFEFTVQSLLMSVVLIIQIHLKYLQKYFRTLMQLKFHQRELIMVITKDLQFHLQQQQQNPENHLQKFDFLQILMSAVVVIMVNQTYCLFLKTSFI